MYYRDDGTGKTTGITFAMYERMPEKQDEIALKHQRRTAI